MAVFEMTSKSVFGRLGVGVRRSAPKTLPKKLQTLEILFDTLIIAQRPEFIDLQRLGMVRFFVAAR